MHFAKAEFSQQNTHTHSNWLIPHIFVIRFALAEQTRSVNCNKRARAKQIYVGGLLSENIAVNIERWTSYTYVSIIYAIDAQNVMFSDTMGFEPEQSLE